MFDNHPQIVGFDMPSASRLDDADQSGVLGVLLNVRPSIQWQQAFARLMPELRGELQISELRLIGQSINVIGSVRNLRLMASALQHMVARVTATCVEDRSSHTAKWSGSTWQPGADGSSQAGATVDTADIRARDIALVGQLADVPEILREVSRLTGMRFCAVARVTDIRWTACAVYDQLDFGLKPGDDLVLETTICNELRGVRQTISFNQASENARFSSHHTPAIYGFESYISVPILLGGEVMFGTLCALDPEPAHLSEEIIEQVQQFARSIAARLIELGSHEELAPVSG